MENNTKSTGVSFGGLLQLAFIILKLCGVIKWSWWLVLTPLWISLSIILIAIIIVAVKSRN